MSDMQLDALKEIGNIGAGNAATVLSQMVNKKIDMTVPQVSVLPFEKMIEKIGSEEEIVKAILLKVFGDAPGDILYVMKTSSASSTVDILLKDFKDVSEEVYNSAYQEIGNILGNSYINAITKVTGLNMMTSVPMVCEDMLAAIITSSFMDAEQYDDNVLSIDTRFSEDEKETGGFFIYIPKPGSLEKILNNLGL